jgi:hypothetical protein
MITGVTKGSLECTVPENSCDKPGDEMVSWNGPGLKDLLIKALFLLKVVPEVIDPVMGSFQLGCIKRQIRTIEATNICKMNLHLVIHPFIGRLPDRRRRSSNQSEIMGWNHGLRIISPDDCIDLNAREY